LVTSSVTIGKIDLAFLQHYTKFANLARSL